MSVPTRSAPAATQVLLVAGEASGDLHGAELVDRAAPRRSDASRSWGVGGDAPARRPACTSSSTPPRWPPWASSRPSARSAAWWRPTGSSSAFMIEERPALVVLIDYPEFNLLPRQACQGARHPGLLLHRAAGVGLAARPRPQDRAARRPARRRLSRSSRRSTTTAVSWRSSSAIRCSTWCGRRARARRRWRATTSIPTRRVLALLPGSRKKEVRLPAAARRSPRRSSCSASGWQPMIALAHTLTRADLAEALGGTAPPVPDGRGRHLQRRARRRRRARRLGDGDPGDRLARHGRWSSCTACRR